MGLCRLEDGKKRCMEFCRPVDGRPERHITQEAIQFDVVELFYYLGDGICPEGSCEQIPITRTRAAWGKFCKLLPLLTSTAITLARSGTLYNSCVRGSLLHASECWPLRREKMQHILHNKRAILCWILKIKVEDNVSLSAMYGPLSLAPVQSTLILNCLR